MKPIHLFALLLVTLLSLACGAETGGDETGPPAIALGESTCAHCGMKIQDERFAPVLRDASSAILSFDAIECLIQNRREAGGLAAARIWLPDLGDGELYPQEEMTVVEGGFPSPMGGGFAAFRDAELARRLATERKGRSGGLEDFVTGGGR